MSRVSAALRKPAKTAGAKVCTTKCKTLHLVLPFERFLRQVWPTDTAKQVGRVTGKSLRAIKYQLAGKCQPSFADVVAILRSEHGFALLKYIMGDARPAWWRGVQQARKLGDARRKLAQLNSEIAQGEFALD